MIFEILSRSLTSLYNIGYNTMLSARSCHPDKMSDNIDIFNSLSLIFHFCIDKTRTNNVARETIFREYRLKKKCVKETKMGLPPMK